MNPAIFPLHAISPTGRCPCGNVDPEHRQGKCPNGGWKNLQPSEQRIPPPGCGYGIATGSRSGFFVVDLDVKPEKDLDGIAEFMRIAAGRPVPRTHAVRTGNGRGVHLRFALPADFEVRNSQSRIGRGIDIRGEGGFIVGPGSPHESGGVYTVIEDRPVLPAPDWLLDMLRAPPPAKLAPVAAIAVGSPAPAGGGRAAAAAALRAAWPSSGRHLAQLALAGACIRGGWSDAETFEFLVAVCGEPQKRAQTVADTRARHVRGETYSGFASLKDHVAEGVVDAVRTLTGLSDELDVGDFLARPVPAGVVAPVLVAGGNRRLRRQGHAYTHTPGVNAPVEKRRSATMSELIRIFRGAPEWAGVWQYDEFARKLLAVDPPMRLDAETTGISERDVTAVRTWFEANGFKCTDQEIAKAIHAAAAQGSFHPVREYLLALPRPKYVGLLDGLAAKVLGNPSASASAFLRLFLVAAVRRILWPGTKVDTMLVLYSPKEGRFKSTFAEALFGVWFRDQMPALDGRDASHALEGYWGIEIPELDRIMRAETSTTKEFLSRRIDKYRAFGNGQKVEFPRECVFIGTTNYPDFLESDTGNRRFWPIEVYGAIDLAFVRAQRDAIWAEAVALALDPTVKHWLDEAQEEAAAEVRVSFDKRDPWHDAVADYCAGREEIANAGQVYLERIAVGEDGALAKATKAHLNRIAAILRKLGCTSETKWVDTKKVRFWKMSDALRNASSGASKSNLFN